MRSHSDSSIGEFRRALKPSGKLIITVWNLWQAKYLGLILEYAFKKISGQSQLDFKDVLVPWKSASGEVITSRYYHTFCPRELRKILQNNSFVIQEAGRFGGPDNRYNIYAVAEK